MLNTRQSSGYFYEWERGWDNKQCGKTRELTEEQWESDWPRGFVEAFKSRRDVARWAAPQWISPHRRTGFSPRVIPASPITTTSFHPNFFFHPFGGFVKNLFVVLVGKRRGALRGFHYTVQFFFCNVAFFICCGEGRPNFLVNSILGGQFQDWISLNMG